MYAHVYVYMHICMYTRTVAFLRCVHSKDTIARRQFQIETRRHYDAEPIYLRVYTYVYTCDIYVSVYIRYIYQY